MESQRKPGQGEPLRIGILALRGDWDFGLKGVIARVLAPLEKTDVAILGFADVSFCDSTFVSAIVRLRKRMEATGGRAEIRIAAPREAFRKLLAVSNLDTIFTICDSMAAAMTFAEETVTTYTGEANGDEEIARLEPATGVEMPD